MSSRKEERRAAEAARAAREAEILRKAGTLEPRPAPRRQPARTAAPGAGTVTPPGSAGPDGQGKAGAAARRPQARPPAPPRESRPRVTRQQAFSAALTAALAARTAWDEPPALYTVHHSWGACRLQPLKVPPGSWYGRSPHDVILSIALTISAAPSRRHPPDLLGVAVRTEGWVLLNEDMTPGQRRRAAAGRLTRVSLETNRVEARVLHGIDTAGTDYHLHRPRGGKLVTFIRPPGGEAADLGEVPEALRSLLDAITSRQPQPQDPER
jgi:hypothetical protein